MFGFNFLRGVHGKDQNLPRVRVTTLKERQMDSCLISVNTVEVFFIESHHKIENSNIVLMGMRSQLLYRDGERALAVMLNMIRANYGHAGMSSHIDVFFTHQFRTTPQRDKGSIRGATIVRKALQRRTGNVCCPTTNI